MADPVRSQADEGTELPAAPSDTAASPDAANDDTASQGLPARLRSKYRAWFDSDDRGALKWWWTTRLVVVVIALNAPWLLAGGDDRKPAGFFERWDRWDVQHYERIAVWGYDGPPGDPARLEAFFPGYPYLLRLVHFFIPQWQLAGILISLVASSIAIVALSRLAVHEHGRKVGERAALFLVASPTAVFLAAGYTEALFLAFAIPAWLSARRGNWWLACLLAAGASTVRINGLFLAIALIVEFVFCHVRPAFYRNVAPAPKRHWTQAPWLLVPFLPIVAYGVYLYQRTGDWYYWATAQKEGWARYYTGITDAFHATWNAAFSESLNIGWQWTFRFELLAVAIGVIVTVVLLIRLRWGEAIFIGATVFVLATSTWYVSVPRYMLVWWPLWIGLAWLSLRPKWGEAVRYVYLVIAVPLSVLMAAMFLTGRWAG